MFINKAQSSVRTRNVFGHGFEQTTLVIHEEALRPKEETAELSKSHGSQVVAGHSLPMVYVTPRIIDLIFSNEACTSSGEPNRIGARTSKNEIMNSLGPA
jgi:hypothetical protein